MSAALLQPASAPAPSGWPRGRPGAPCGPHLSAPHASARRRASNRRPPLRPPRSCPHRCRHAALPAPAPPAPAPAAWPRRCSRWRRPRRRAGAGGQERCRRPLPLQSCCPRPSVQRCHRPPAPAAAGPPDAWHGRRGAAPPQSAARRASPGRQSRPRWRRGRPGRRARLQRRGRWQGGGGGGALGAGMPRRALVPMLACCAPLTQPSRPPARPAAEAGAGAGARGVHTLPSPTLVQQ